MGGELVNPISDWDAYLKNTAGRRCESGQVQSNNRLARQLEETSKIFDRKAERGHTDIYKSRQTKLQTVLHHTPGMHVPVGEKAIEHTDGSTVDKS